MYRHGTASEELAFRAAGCFCFCEGDLLLIQRGPRKSLPLLWGVPTGKLESGETPREAMRRELMEEVGLDVPPEALEEVVEAIVGEGQPAFAYTSFHLALDRRPPLRPDPREVHTLRWLPPATIPTLKTVPYFLNTLNDVLAWRRQGLLPTREHPELEARCIAEPGS